MALEIKDNPAATGLCDDAFYTEAIASGFLVTGIQLLQHEGVFVAAPFCCDILLDWMAMAFQNVLKMPKRTP